MEDRLIRQSEDICNLKSSLKTLENKHIESDTQLQKIHNICMNVLQKVTDIECIKPDMEKLGTVVFRMEAEIKQLINKPQTSYSEKENNNLKELENNLVEVKNSLSRTYQEVQELKGIGVEMS